MGAISKLIEVAIGIGVLLAATGGLKPVTIFLAGEVAKQQKRGLVSLSDLNYGLMGKETYCENISWPDEKRCPEANNRQSRQ